ncbi:MAG: class I SAM-dependent methyltransferase [Patescibacteria group bacterium]|jgi:ubiquinone/menaquinone biosynthesis C-methylase UbiE
MNPSVFKYFLRYRPLFLALIRSREIELYQQNMTLSKKVLDFGSGDGFFLDTLQRFYPKVFKNAHIVGIDVNKTSLEESRTYDLYDQLVSYDGKKLPFASQSFDTVFSNCVFEHLPDLALNLKEMHRVLKPGGKLYTTVMAKPWDWYVVLPASFWRKKQVHINLLSQTGWEQAFAHAGFKVKKSVGYLSKQQSRIIELAHFLSIPYLLSYILTKKWSLVGPLFTKIVPVEKLQQMFAENVKVKKAAALYFTLEKPRSSPPR